MKNLSSLFCLLLFLFITESSFAQWQVLGNTIPTSNQLAYSHGFSVKDGVPYIAYMDHTKNNKATVALSDGTNWSPVGLAGFSTGEAQDIHLFVEDHNDIYVAYRDVADGGKITVQKYNGNNWTPVGISNFAGYDPAITVKNDTPYVAYRDYNHISSSNVLAVKKYDGTNWVSVGSNPYSSLGTNNIPTDPIMHFNNGELYIGFEVIIWNGFPYYNKIMKFNGTSWTDVGTQNFQNYGESRTYFSFKNNLPYFAYLDYNTSTVIAKKFDGTNWTNIGQNSVAVAMGPSPCMVVHNGIPFVSYRDFSHNGKITVMMLDGNYWVPVGGSRGVSPDPVKKPKMVIEGNKIYIAYTVSIPIVGTPYYTNRIEVLTFNTPLSMAKTKEVNNSFSIYPNPAKKILNISCEDQVESVAILSIEGQTLKQLNTLQVPIEDLPQGIYIIQVKTEKGIGHQRFVKQ